MELSRNKKIILVIIFTLAFAGIYFFLSVYMNANVYRAHEGLVLNEDQVVAEEVLIVIAGERHISLTKDNVIYGTVTIADGATYNIMLTDDGKGYRGTIYEGFGASNLVEVGEINATSGLKELYITLDEIDEKYGSGSVVYGPALSLEEAQAIQKVLSTK